MHSGDRPQGVEEKLFLLNRSISNLHDSRDIAENFNPIKFQGEVVIHFPRAIAQIETHAYQLLVVQSLVGKTL